MDAGRRTPDALPVLLLMGPTCSGKTALAIEAAQSLPIEIINVDSALVYRQLDIGAARPTPEELAVAPHRLLGFRDITDPYSAADFRADALREIQAVHDNGKLPLLVGGTILYFKALVEGLAPLPEADPEVRAEIAALAEREGWPAVHAALQAVDPVTAARLNPTDRQRLQRALEVFRVTGRPLSAFHADHHTAVTLRGDGLSQFSALSWPVYSAALAPADRGWLHAMIEKRFDAMLAQGLVQEVRGLREMPGVHRDLPAVKAVGYRQVWDYLSGDYDQPMMVQKGVIATRQLAKRQYTWLRKWPNLAWFDSNNEQQRNALSGQLAKICKSVFI
ncbi:MAG: tRNA (adenosine(37)-N6)-dimethylallyltransferase MiaA [Pseudomonadota bacterium]|uniref:tRNA (adenosine(37)-N6)-dimethylallyltransferase MiaA n=1 Tax=Alcanivorax sp. TaxID=1872427 RepID=UPI0025B817E2|nr:tRNA (adenosine(37)-N6)-dimethylallyltransferase MiaA [Alcanivorax sp.]MED5238403.1 tRNA (adenosine(37)-N6)-dimethylallyltransferase MiaA [Pseudomonadota bacterium]MEE3319574.1 tRNA (adenosine(37)-N6)-dimethylallyltransferase MiaA [Pseudomonadota bacterium]